MAVIFRSDFGPEDGDSMFLRNVDNPPDHNMKSDLVACIDSELILRQRILKVFRLRS
jgi:hypothetical protein